MKRTTSANHSSNLFVSGPPATVFGADDATGFQEELANIIEDVGLVALNGAALDQCAVALGGARGIKAHATDTGVATTGNKRAIVASTDCQATGADAACVASDGCIASGANSATIASLDGDAVGAQSAIVACSNTDAGGAQSAAIACSGGYVKVGATRGVMVGNDGCYVSGGNSVLLASLNAELTTSYQVALGYDGGAAISESTSDQKLTIRLDAVSGNGYFDGVADNGSADFAEMFENLEPGEIAPGLLVAREGRRVRMAKPGDRLLGVVSASPAVLGNSGSLGWHGRFDHDEWGRRVLEEHVFAEWPHLVRETPSEDGKRIVREVVRPGGRVRVADGVEVPPDARFDVVRAPRRSAAHNSTRAYVPRRERPEEWTPVALVGQVRVRIGEKVEPSTVELAAGPGGIAVPCETSTGARLELLEILQPWTAERGYGIALALVR